MSAAGAAARALGGILAIVLRASCTECNEFHTKDSSRQSTSDSLGGCKAFEAIKPGSHRKKVAGSDLMRNFKDANTCAARMQHRPLLRSALPLWNDIEQTAELQQTLGDDGNGRSPRSVLAFRPPLDSSSRQRSQSQPSVATDDAVALPSQGLQYSNLEPIISTFFWRSTFAFTSFYL